MYEKELIERARKARENAYAPYSKFKVGAAILTEDGEVYTGVNVENASFGLTVCAERVALFKAVSDGKRSFKAIAVVADSEEPVPPCGACRQVLSEFGDMKVIMANLKGDVKIARLRDLLPDSFKFEEGKR
ncbi:MAG: cytidine deaminase [Thermotoga sp. 4484_232]|nr:MAG: cytidine deaminase [Thermotoga sp. 4484_232]